MADIREKAETLIKYIDDVNSRGADSTADWDSRCEPFKELKAALKPSREEIADYLEKHNKWRRGGDDGMGDPRELGDYINYAIEELRK